MFLDMNYCDPFALERSNTVRVPKVILAMLIGGLMCSMAQAETRPNIITIVTDDQGQWAMGAYGNSEIHTPAMDRIANEGALFDNAVVVTPVCSPARATWFTGRYPTELGITDWISEAEWSIGMGLDDPTWAEVLQDNGYMTAMIGKWHLGTHEQYHPTNKGFDYFMGFLGGGNKPMDATLEVDGKEQLVKGPLPDVLMDATLEWLETVGKNPFALSLHFRAPHLRYTPVPESDSAHYTDLDPTIPSFQGINEEVVKKSTKEYYGSISSVDRNIARLLHRLDERGLMKNTIVLFTSDHGYNEGRHGVTTKGNGHWWAGGVRGPKRPNMFDSSLKVPLAIRWPGVVKPGMRLDTMVSNLDMYRTVLGMAGLEVPDGVSPHGMDFTPVLRGEMFEDRDLFGQYDLHNSGLAYMRMIRTEDYKYIRFFHANGMDEFYDLKNDPDEEINLIRTGKAPEKTLAKLQAKLLEHMTAINDPLLEDKY
jgi:choline-sulfatase